MTTDTDRAHQAAAFLQDASAAGTMVEAMPEHLRPETEADGYAVQEQLVALRCVPRAGWKISATSERAQQVLGVSGPFSGWLTQDMLVDDNASLAGRGLRMTGVEAEYGIRLKAMTSAPSSIEDLLDSIASVHLLLEICSIGFQNFAAQGGPVHIADNAAAAFAVVGPALPSWSPQMLIDTGITLSVNGQDKAQGAGAAVLGNPLGALLWLVRDRIARGARVQEGFIVATGACTPLTIVMPGDRVEARFDGLGKVGVDI